MDAELSITQTRLYNQLRSVKFRPLVLLSLQQQQQQRDILYCVVVVIYSCSSLDQLQFLYRCCVLRAADSYIAPLVLLPPSLPLPPQTIRTIIERRPAMPTSDDDSSNKRLPRHTAHLPAAPSDDTSA